MMHTSAWSLLWWLYDDDDEDDDDDDDDYTAWYLLRHLEKSWNFLDTKFMSVSDTNLLGKLLWKIILNFLLGYLLWSLPPVSLLGTFYNNPQYKDSACF